MPTGEAYDFYDTRLLGITEACLKSFRVNATIGVGADFRQKMALPAEAVQADQGSEANLISQRFVNENGVPVLDLASIGFKGLQMANADGSRAPVTHFVLMTIMCEGIKREAWVIVKPDLKSAKDDVVMLLGLLWLFDVGAVIDIR